VQCKSSSTLTICRSTIGRYVYSIIATLAFLQIQAQRNVGALARAFPCATSIPPRSTVTSCTLPCTCMQIIRPCECICRYRDFASRIGMRMGIVSSRASCDPGHLDADLRLPTQHPQIACQNSVLVIGSQYHMGATVSDLNAMWMHRFPVEGFRVVVNVDNISHPTL
jgi:hypothetical protein